MEQESLKFGWEVFIPPLSYSTDNAAMIAISGYYRYLGGHFSSDDVTPLARMYFCFSSKKYVIKMKMNCTPLPQNLVYWSAF